MKLFLHLILTVTSLNLIAQGNCLIYPENSDERKACEYGYKAIQYKQGSRESLQLFDTAIVLNPNYAWAYYEKSVAYFKRGYLNEGMNLLNKAVELDPLSHLTYRAYWYFNHNSYELCKADLERFYSMPNAYQKYTPGGGIDMRVFLGLAYSELGMKQEAINAVEKALRSYPSDDFIGVFDFHILGVLYLKNEQHILAERNLLKSIDKVENFASTYYYLGLTADKLGKRDEAVSYFNKAINLFESISLDYSGYSGYPFCFPVSKEMVNDQLTKVSL